MVPMTALITGGMSDIGRATAVTLARAGYGVAVGFRRDAEAAERFARALADEHGAPQALAIRADIRRRGEVAAMVEQAWIGLGEVRVLVNGAGINRDRPFVEMTDAEWEEVRATVLDGAFYCCQEFARRFQGEEGRILNIGAVTAIRGRKNGVNYCSARAGVVALTKCLAQELAPRISVVTVTPGMIDTAEVGARYNLGAAENRARWEASIPLGRLGSPWDVAGMIEFLARPGCYVNGQNILVDGGYFPH